jgi:hypothetical protein
MSESRIEVSTILSAQNQLGRVQLDISGVKLYDGKFQWPVEVARDIALQILAAAEAAEMEATVLRFLQSPEVGLKLQEAARVVAGFRSARAAVSKESLAQAEYRKEPV